MESGGSCALRHQSSPCLAGTDLSKHYITMYQSLAAVWLLPGLAWLAVCSAWGSCFCTDAPVSGCSSEA